LKLGRAFHFKNCGNIARRVTPAAPGFLVHMIDLIFDWRAILTLK